MTPAAMRWVDRWVGSPCCALLTLFDRLGRRLAHSAGPLDPPRRILFVGMAEAGGLVVAAPAFAHAERLFPGCECCFLTFPLGREVLQLLGREGPGRVLTIRPEARHFLADTWRAVRQLRRLRPDATVNLEAYGRFSTILAHLSGARRRAGFFPFHEAGAYLGDLVTHKVIYNPHRHASETFLGLVGALAEDPDREPRGRIAVADVSRRLPVVSSRDSDLEAIRALVRESCPGHAPGGRLVILNPNANDPVPVRRWPREHVVALGQGLLADPAVLLVLIGGADEGPPCEALRQTLGAARVANLAGRTTLPQLVHLCNASDLLVTSDSGPAHFASLTRVPVLVLFGPETPCIYGPLGPAVEVVYRGLACSPCISAYNRKRSPCRDNRCMKLIGPSEVLERARQILARDAGDASLSGSPADRAAAVPAGPRP